MFVSYSIIKKNEKNLEITFSKNVLDKILRKEIRQLKDEKMMSPQDIKMLSCYKKDNIELVYELNKDDDIVIKIQEK